MPKRKAPAQPRTLEKNEQMRLLDWLRTSSFRDYTLVLLCLRTGLRNAEALGLDVGDIQKFSSIVTTLEVREDIAKNGVPRRLPLVPELIRTLEIFLQWKTDNSQSIEHDAPLFCSALTRKRLQPRDFQRIMKKATSQGLETIFTPHDLRHTFGTELYEATGNLEIVRVALGHSSIQSTQIYMHTSMDKMREGFTRAFDQGQVPAWTPPN